MSPVGLQLLPHERSWLAWWKPLSLTHTHTQRLFLVSMETVCTTEAEQEWRSWIWTCWDICGSGGGTLTLVMFFGEAFKLGQLTALLMNVTSKWCDCKINILMSLKLFGDEAWRKCDMVLGWCLSPSFLTSWPCLSLPWCTDCYAALNLPLALYPDPSCIRGDQLSAQSIPLFLLTDRIALRTQTWRLDEGQRSAHRLRQRWIQMKTDG